jgi:hypothetical protein
VVSSSLRDRPHNEPDIDSVETDKRQRANQTKPIVNSSDSDKPPLSVAESAGQTLAPTTVSGSSLPDLDKDGPNHVVFLARIYLMLRYSGFLDRRQDVGS